IDREAEQVEMQGPEIEEENVADRLCDGAYRCASELRGADLRGAAAGRAAQRHRCAERLVDYFDNAGRRRRRAIQHTLHRELMRDRIETEVRRREHPGERAAAHNAARDGNVREERSAVLVLLLVVPL